MSTLLLLQPPTYFAGQKNRSTGNQACGTASHCLDRIVNSAVTVRSQQLHKLQQQGATKNDQAYKSNVSWIRKAKQGAENCRRREMFKLVDANTSAWHESVRS